MRLVISRPASVAVGCLQGTNATPLAGGSSLVSGMVRISASIGSVHSAFGHIGINCDL
jgi:hypothetical protein